jgi:GT2 family glycosyltransferase
MGQPTVFIIIPTWNLREDTVSCVDSVLAGGYSRQRVVVIDNGSQDGSPDALADHFGSSIDQFVNSENLGFARGANVGIRHALAQGADYVLLLNNDTVIDERLVEQLAAVSEADPAATVLAPAIYYYGEPARFWRLGAVKKWWLPVPYEIGRDVLDKEQFSRPFDVDYVTGCAMWVPAELFQTVGLLDERFFMYYEDADFCERVRNAGHRIKVVPQAHVWHKVSRSTQEQVPWAVYHQTRNRIIFYNRSKKGLACAVTNLYVLISTLAKMIRAWNDRLLLDSLWSGFRDGWRSRQDSVSTSGGP